jgi:hypothetical protein
VVVQSRGGMSGACTPSREPYPFPDIWNPLSATVAKLVHNMSGYALVCALAETFTMGVKAGVEPLALWQAVRQGAAGRRFTFDALIDQFLPGKYDPPAFALKLAHKDVSLANTLGRELGVPMRMCNLTLAEMTEAKSSEASTSGVTSTHSIPACPAREKTAFQDLPRTSDYISTTLLTT